MMDLGAISLKYLKMLIVNESKIARYFEVTNEVPCSFVVLNVSVVEVLQQSFGS